nr:LPXTG cell wall anchor domain-containing protein [Streptomyces sp. TRM68416]
MLTATAAGTLLGALWFVPSANATADQTPSSATAATQATQQARATTPQTSDVELADTGSFDTTPYVVGGTAFLALGAGFVAYSVRRERHGF